MITRPLWVIAALLFTFAAVFAGQCLPGVWPGSKELATLGLDWQGDFIRTADGLHAGGSPGVKVASALIPLVPHTKYELRLTVTTPVPLHVDFFGPNYDNDAQESIIEPPGSPRVTRRLCFDSGDCPDLAAVRIFYDGDADVTIHRVSVVRTTALMPWVRGGLFLLPIIILGALGRVFLPADGFAALGLTALVLSVYLAVSGHVPVADDSDNLWYLPTADSLLHDGDLDLAEHAARIERMQGYGTVKHPNVGVINIFPFGTSLIAVPFLAVARQFHASNSQIAGWLAALLAAGTVGALFLCLRQLALSRGWATGLALVFAFASSEFSVHATGLWSHNAALFVGVTYLWLLLRPEPVAVGCAAPLGVFGYLCRPDFSLLIAAGFVYLCLERRALAGWFLGLTLLAIAPFLLWSWSSFGSLVPPYYRSDRVHLSPQMPVVMLGQMFSPNRGLFIFNPFVLLGVVGGVLSLVKPIPHRRFFQALFAVFVLHATVISAFPHWWGGFSFGPRLFMPVIGALFVLTVPLFRALPKWPTALRRAVWVFVAASTLWGAFVHYRGATAYAVHAWNSSPGDVDRHPESIWSWRRMQIFEGL